MKRMSIPLMFVWIGGMFLSAPVASAAAQATSTQFQSRSGVSFNAQAPAWVVQAQPYVHVLNGMAWVDPAIYGRLGSTVIQQVKLAVTQFNAQDRAFRMGDVTYIIPDRQLSSLRTTGGATTMGTPASCRGRSIITISTQWWGRQYWFSSCAVTNMIFAGGTAAAIAAIVAVACPPAAPVAGAIGAVLALYVGWMAWADAYCGGRGIYLNQPWSGPMWVSRVC